MAGDWPPAHAVISGGSSGIGLALARRLAAGGTRVSLIARDPGRLGAAAAELGGLALAADVRDAAAVAAAVARAEAERGPIDVLVACAGAVRVGNFADLPEGAFAEMTAINYLGAVHLMRAGLPGMRARGRGRALLVGSAGTLAGVWGYGAYAPAKAALAALGAVLRAECRPDGVRVGVAFPPDTETPQLAAERAERPPQTAAVAGGAGVMRAEAVAAALERGLRAGRAEIFVSPAVWALGRLGPAVRPLIDRWLDRTAARAGRDQAGSGPTRR